MSQAGVAPMTAKIGGVIGIAEATLIAGKAAKAAATAVAMAAEKAVGTVAAKAAAGATDTYDIGCFPSRASQITASLMRAP